MLIRDRPSITSSIVQRGSSPRRAGLRFLARAGILVAAAVAGGCARAGGGVGPTPAGAVAPGQMVYDTDLRLDLAAGTLEGRSTLRFAAGDSTARGIGLLLNRGLQVRSVTGAAVDGHRVEPFEAVPVWNVVRVDFAEGVAPGSAVTIDIAWAGRPEFPRDTSNRISPDLVELNLDSQWHPMVSTFDHPMTGVVRVALPSSWRVAASGRVALHDGVHVVRNTIPQVDVALIAAPSFQETRSARYTALHRGPESPAARAVLAAAENCATHLNRRFGSRDSLPRGTVVLAGRGGPGYARKNYVVLSNVNPGDSVAVHGYLCHELAHYWTRSAGSFSPHHWMTETFAEYASGRFLRERFGEAAFRAEVARWEETGRAHGPVWTPESTRRPTYAAMYRRGPWLLSRLEERIGTERFDGFMERYMAGGVRTTPELLDALEAAAGADAAQWFRAELASAPAPAN